MRVVSELLTSTPTVWKQNGPYDPKDTRYRNERTDMSHMKLLTSAQNGVTDIHCTTPQKQNSSCNPKESYFLRY